MAAVHHVLKEVDVHSLLSCGDPVVDRCTALPPWLSPVAEFDTKVGSSMKAHFDFPQDPSVIDEVVTILKSHAEGYGETLERSGPALSLARV